MACASLERMRIVHNDLHLGNILYHEEESEKENKGRWLWYRDGKDDIYVKHTGTLWVLWDFGLMINADETRDGDPFFVNNTFIDDITSRFFPLLKQKFLKQSASDPKAVWYTHPFIEVLDDLLKENDSIITVLNLLAYNNYYDMIRAEWTEDMDVINSRPYIV